MRLIDADTLIEKCGNWYVEEGTESGFIGTLKNLLVIQPTVQPNLQPTYNQLATDTISRRQAIKALSTITMYKGSIPFNTAVMRIKQLPSAQPEIIRCRDCRYYNSEEKECLDLLGHGRRWEEDDFCSYGVKMEVTE